MNVLALLDRIRTEARTQRLAGRTPYEISKVEDAVIDGLLLAAAQLGISREDALAELDSRRELTIYEP